MLNAVALLLLRGGTKFLDASILWLQRACFSRHGEALWNTNGAVTPPKGRRHLTNPAAPHKSPSTHRGSLANGMMECAGLYMCGKSAEMMFVGGWKKKEGKRF